MNDDLLATYLNDHLAGSVGAIELLGRLADKEAAGSARQREMTGLREKIQEDQEVLKQVLDSRDTDQGQSAVKQAGAWVMEKMARAKLRLAESAGAGLGEVEALEVLSLGIAGKKGLWEVLREVMPEGEFPGRPWEAFIQSADEQRATVERWRLEAARKAFRPDATV